MTLKQLLLPSLLLLMVAACSPSTTEKKQNQTSESEDISTEASNPTAGEEIQEYGLIELIEDGVYPQYIVTVNFVERNISIDYNLNIEEIALNPSDLYALEGLFAQIYYTSEIEESLTDIQIDGATIFGEYAFEFDPSWKKFTGKLTGADATTPSDLPDTITITKPSGDIKRFDTYIDEELMSVNQTIVTAYYELRTKNTITKLSPSPEQ